MADIRVLALFNPQDPHRPNDLRAATSLSKARKLEQS
jgi:hypothetical protein